MTQHSHQDRSVREHARNAIRVMIGAASIVFLMAIFFSLTSHSSRDARGSHEAYFTDSTIGGMQLVPASGGSLPSGCGDGTLNDQCPCYSPWGAYVGHGGAIGAYAAPTVSYGQSCLGETRWCNNGSLSGSYNYVSCSVNPPADCAVPWGGTLGHGGSVTAYQASSVVYGQSCVSESRSCNNGSLSGSYSYSSCSVNAPANCTAPWGATVSHGASVTAYPTPGVPYGWVCGSETRTCNDGSLSGGYSYSSCSPAAPPVPSCSVGVSPGTINQGSSSTLSWSSSDASSFYISNVGYVTANQSSNTSVAPSVSTAYSGSVSGPGGNNSCSATLTVHPSCTFNGSTVTHGSSVTAYQASSVPFGGSCASESRSCSDGSLSGSYAYASCSVASAANCTLDSVTVNHGNSRTFYTSQITSGGQLCSAVSQSRTCTNGTLSGSATYQYANCSCGASYSCSGSNITYTDSACSTSTTATCNSPSFCTVGISSCQWPAIGYTAYSPTISGHLTATPGIIHSGDTVKLYWNVTNATSCTVSGGGQTWNLTSSGSSGVTTNAITHSTSYSLHCDGYSGQLDAIETFEVVIQPVFQEQ